MQEQQAHDYKPNPTADKATRYENIKQAFADRLDSNSHPLSNTSNLLALLKEEFQWWWIGFYWLRFHGKEQEHLALGQFQGPPACTKLWKGHGVCAAAWAKNQTVIVEDVSKFEGHVACSSLSKSQIVVPVRWEGRVVGVLDIDSAKLRDFDKQDQKNLQELLQMINQIDHFRWFAENL